MRSRLRGIALAVATAAGVVSLVTPQAALAEVPPSVGIAITFERGCPRGEGTLESINENTGPAAAVRRIPVLWGREGKLRSVDLDSGLAFYPIGGTDDRTERGDRVVVRLLSAEGRLLFTSEVPYYPEPLLKPRGDELLSAPEYWLAVRLDCSQIPYSVAAQLAWPFEWPAALPATSTAPAPPESPPVPLILVTTFGLAFAGAWRYLSRRSQRTT